MRPSRREATLSDAAGRVSPSGRHSPRQGPVDGTVDPSGLSLFLFTRTHPFDLAKSADVRSYDVVGVLWKRRGGMGRYALGGCAGLCQSVCMREGWAAMGWDGGGWGGSRGVGLSGVAAFVGWAVRRPLAPVADDRISSPFWMQHIHSFGPPTHTHNAFCRRRVAAPALHPAQGRAVLL